MSLPLHCRDCHPHCLLPAVKILKSRNSYQLYFFFHSHNIQAEQAVGKCTSWGRFKAGTGNENIIRGGKKNKKILCKRSEKKRNRAAGNRRGLETASPRGGPGPSPAAPVAVEAVVGAAVPLRPPLLSGAALLAALQFPLVAVRQCRQHPEPEPEPEPGTRRASAAAAPRP